VCSAVGVGLGRAQQQEQSQPPAELRPALETEPLNKLRKLHSRLLLQESDPERIRLLMRENALAKRIFADLEKECERLQTALPVEYRW
jgi:hypothetical protein